MSTRLLLLLGFAVSAAAQTVEGSVLDASTGHGIAHVKVELLKRATPFYETATDGAGRFRFDDLREGDYAVRYQSPDYFLTAGPSDYRTFPVAAGTPVNLEGRLMPWSRISGRVIDTSGNGIAKAQVQVTGPGMTINGRTYLRSSWGGGGGGQLSDAPMEMAFSGMTGGDGGFSVQLMPGSYRLSVSPPADLKPPESTREGPRLAWVRTYFPGAMLPEAAARITVLPGSDVSGLEIKLQAAPAHAVHGVVLLSDGSAAEKATLRFGEAFRPVTTQSDRDGTFTFPAVPEGDWLFTAEVQRGASVQRAMDWIPVGSHDIENVKLRLAPPLNIRGRIVADAPPDGALPRFTPMILNVARGSGSEGADMEPQGSMLLSSDSKGNLNVENAYPGVYRLMRQLQPPPPPYYLDSVRLGDADLTTQPVEISNDIFLSVVYKRDGGTVRGKVENCASGGVLLVPADPERRHRGFSNSAGCDSSGNYEIRAVRPGDYVALAFAGNSPVFAVDDAMLKEGVRVTVRSGEVSTAEPPVVSKPLF